MTSPTMLTGAEYVLVAHMPKAGDRWQQVHFNQRVAEQFFRLRIGDSQVATLERVDDEGRIAGHQKRSLVYSESNKNCKMEFDFPGRTYPASGVPLLVVVELGVRRFRYRALFPGVSGYDEMLDLTAELPRVGRGLPRVVTTLDEVELRWEDSHLRHPLPPASAGAGAPKSQGEPSA